MEALSIIFHFFFVESTESLAIDSSFDPDTIFGKLWFTNILNILKIILLNDVAVSTESDEIFYRIR